MSPEGESEYQGKKRALIISISEYDNLQPLEFCRKDGNKKYKVLEQLQYHIPDNYKLIGGRLEYWKIRKAIIDFFYDRTIYPKDTVLFYFSGHGLLGDDGEHYLSTSEIDPDIPQGLGFSFDELSKARANCNSKTIFTILDCCYSGADRPDGKGEDDSANAAKNLIQNKSKALGEGKCILTACKPMQKAYEFKEQGHSFFTFYLAQALSEEECVDEDGDVTPYKLNEYIGRRIRELPAEKRPKQTPFLNCQTDGKIVLAHKKLTTNVYQPSVSARESGWQQDFEEESSSITTDVEQMSESRFVNDDWLDLLYNIRDAACTPILGRWATPGYVQLEQNIVKQWAEEYHYPFADYSNVMKVSEFLAIQRNDKNFPKKLISRMVRKIQAPDFSDPYEIHGVLADLNLPLYVTTNYDDFMFQALQSRGKKPVRDFLRWNDYLAEMQSDSEEKSLAPNEATSERPLVYHLSGDARIPESIVLTESDYQDLVSRLNYDERYLPLIIRLAASSSMLLYIGYNISDPRSVSILNLINRFTRQSSKSPTLVHSLPTNKHNLEYAHRYLSTVSKGARIYWGSSHSFAKELRKRLDGSKESIQPKEGSPV